MGNRFTTLSFRTFAHQVANGESPKVDRDGQLNLLHCQEVARIVWEKIEEGFVGECRPQGHAIKVSAIACDVERIG